MTLKSIIEQLNGKSWKSVEQAVAYATGVLTASEDMEPVTSVTIQEVTGLMTAIMSVKVE